jgi:hypothetical protein
MKIISLLMLLSGAISLSASQKATQKYDFIPIFEQKQQIVLKRQPSPTSTNIKFPAAKKQTGKTICLRFKAFLKTKTNAGWNDYLAITMNGHVLDQNTSTGSLRLLRRGKFMHNTLASPHNIRPWWRNNALIVFFNNGKGEVDPRVKNCRQEGLTYLVDISDYINYVEYGADDRIENAKPNILRLTNLFCSEIAPNQFPGVDMYIENLEIGYIDNAQVKLMLPKETEAAINIKYSPIAAKVVNDNYTLKVYQGGGMSINAGNQTFAQLDKFSYPAEPSMKFNELTPEKVKGQSTWHPKISKQGNIITIKCKAKQYNLTRTIKVEKQYISVLDKFTNTSKNPIGISLKLSTVTPARLQNKDFRLAGIPGASFDFGVATNPTLFMKSKNASLGVLAEDNILRNQISLSHKGNSLSMNDNHFGLKPGASHSLFRTFWPASNGNYWQFINKVRKHNNLNIKLTGPFCFGLPVKKMDSKILTIGQWFEYFKGIQYTRQQYKSMMQKQISEIRKKYGQKIILPKTEANLVTIDKRTLPNGKTLPYCGKVCEGQYGKLLSKSQTAVLKNSKYWDSMLFDKDGRAYVDTYYAFEPCLQLLVQIEKDNYRYKNLLEQIDFLIDEVGFDGIYIDQFAAGCGGSLSRRDRCTYNKWDGITVDIDAKGQIKRKYYDYAITGAQARADILQHVLKKGKFIVTNTQPIVNETLKIPAMRFHEMENDRLNTFMLLANDKPPVMKHQARCHLSNSPIILGVRPPRYSKQRHEWAKILNRAVIICLRNGTLYYYYGKTVDSNGGFGPVNNMFPLTPVEFGAGFVIGKERIITCVSRQFTVEGRKPQCLLFDDHGNQIECPFEPSKTAKGWEINVKLNDWNQIAVIKL